MVKYIPDVNSWQLLFVRCVSQLVTMVPIMVLGKHHILGTPDWATRWRLAAQGILGGLLLLGIFEAVARLPLGDCTAIFFSAPAFTMVHYSIWLISNIYSVFYVDPVPLYPQRSLWYLADNHRCDAPGRCPHPLEAGVPVLAAHQQPQHHQQQRRAGAERPS